uniref:Uncharacterized protein n=1 Tax=Acrobeloides nanus TaxID=290746 RepID=A0A914EGD5_9BILA
MPIPASVRANRGWRFAKAYTQYLWNKYTLQVWVYSTYGVIGLAAMCYHLGKDGIFQEHRMPYYRRYYEVVRPNDPIALNRRPPEDYPPPWLSKNAFKPKTIKKD